VSRSVSEKQSRCLSKFFMAMLCSSLLLAGVADTSAGSPDIAPSPLALIESDHFKRARSVVEERYRANPKDPKRSI